MLILKQDNHKAIRKISNNDSSVRALRFDSVNMQELILLARAMQHNTHVVDIVINMELAPYPLSSMRELTMWKLSGEIQKKVEENRIISQPRSIGMNNV